MNSDKEITLNSSNSNYYMELNNISNIDNKVDFENDTLQLAYQLVTDASVGRITNFERTASCLKLYRLYLSKIFRFVRIIVHLTLVFLLIYDSTNRNAQSIVAQITVAIECLCLTFYSFQLFIVYRFSIKERFTRDKKHYVTAIVILISFVDVTLFMNNVYQFRISPALRILLFINSSEQSQIRRHLRTLRMTVYNVLVILPFLVTFYFMMVVFIYRYFKVRQSENIYYFNGKPYMQTFIQIIWDTLVYITSANSPDVMLPAFATSWVLGILFLIFYALIFFLLIFVYGLIMGNFRDHAKEEMRDLITAKMTLLYDAFLLLTEKQPIDDEPRLSDGDSVILKEVVKKEKWVLLMQQNKKYRNCPEAVDLMYLLLCENNRPYLTKNEFMQMGDLLSIPLNIISSFDHFFEKYLWFNFSNKLADVVEHKYFSFAVGLIIVINSICITFTNEHYLELFFSVLFMSEILLRIYVKGFSKYFCSIWNIFDFVVIVLALIFWFVEISKLDVQTVTFTLLVLRNLRLLKLLRGIAAYYKLLHILGMLIPTIASLLIIVFCLTVLFVCIGIWSYQGLFFKTHSLDDYMFNSSDCNSADLIDTDFGRFHYCILSFNSFTSGFITLCSIAVGNNWHVISEGYELGSKQVILSRLYFCLYKGIVTYLLLLIVAFVLDVFLLAYNQKSTLKIEEKVNAKLRQLEVQFISYKDVRESKIKKFTDTMDSSSNSRFFQRVKFQENRKIWFRLKDKGARSVEYVSQAMFQSEVESDLKLNIKFMHYFDSG